MKHAIRTILVLFIYAASSHRALAENAAMVAQASAAVRLKGSWMGLLAVQGLKLRLALRISKTGDGVLVAKLDSIDQGAKDLPVEEITLEGQAVRFSSKRLGLSFAGILNEAGSQIQGEMKQGAATMPLIFERVTALPVAGSSSGTSKTVSLPGTRSLVYE